MKKKLGIILAIMLCVVLVFTLVACGNKDNKTNKDKDGGSTTTIGVSETQINTVLAKIQAQMDSWVKVHAAESIEDISPAEFESDLNESKANYKLTGDKDNDKNSYSASFKVKLEGKDTFKVTVTWGKNQLTKDLTAKAVIQPYKYWSGNGSRTSDYEFVEGKTAASDTLDMIVTAFVNSINDVTSLTPTGKFGVEGKLGFDAFGKNYGLDVKGNINLQAKTSESNEFGIVVVNGDTDKELAGLYYKGASTAAESKIYLKYEKDGKVEYKYLDYADIIGLIKKAIPDDYKYEKQDGVFTFYEEEEGEEPELMTVTGLEDLLKGLGASKSVANLVPSIVNIVAKGYEDGEGRYLVNINLAEVLANVSELIKAFGNVDLAFLDDLGLDIKTMHGLFGHISLSAKLTGDEEGEERLEDLELAVNIPECTFYFTADESENGKKIDIPAISFAIYLSDFNLITTGKVQNVVPTEATTKAEYFCPTNFDIQGDVYVNHREVGKEKVLDSTFHYEFVSDVNPFEVATNGYASTAKGVLSIKQSQGNTYNAATATNFLTIGYDQSKMLLTVSGTAFGLKDEGKQVYTFTYKDKKWDIKNPDGTENNADIKGEIFKWLGLTGYIGLNFDADKGIVLDPKKGTAKDSAQVIFGNKLTQELMGYFIDKYEEYQDEQAKKAKEAEQAKQNGEGAPTAAEGDDAMANITKYVDMIKELYSKLHDEKVIDFNNDEEKGLTFHIGMGEKDVETIIDTLKKVIPNLPRTGTIKEKLEVVTVELNTEGYEKKLYVKVVWGEESYEITFDDSVGKKFTINFVMTLASRRTYNVTFNAETLENDPNSKWKAGVVVDIKNKDKVSENYTKVELSAFDFAWGDRFASRVDALLPGQEQMTAAKPIFAEDGTGPATKLAEGLLDALSADSVYDVTSWLGEFIIRHWVDFSKVKIGE